MNGRVGQYAVLEEVLHLVVSEPKASGRDQSELRHVRYVSTGHRLAGAHRSIAIARYTTSVPGIA
eukprot:3224844-Rhodomonas_salina.11